MNGLLKILAPLALGILVGCDSGGPTSSPEPGHAATTPLYIRDVDLSVETQIEPQRLEVILDALKREGRAEDAERVAATYELSTGGLRKEFRDLPGADDAGALPKVAAWDPSTLKYKSWNNGWQPFVNTPNESGHTAQNGLIMISHNGGAGAPILSVQVSNYYNQWSAARKWNEVVGWPDATGYPTYGLFKLRITTTNALGQGNIISTYQVKDNLGNWSAWGSQGQAVGPTPSGSGSTYMQAFRYKINFI